MSTDNETLRGRLIAERESAFTADEAVSAVTRIEWFNRQHAAGVRDVTKLTCPSDRIPSWETLATTSPPPEVWNEALVLLRSILGEGAAWLPWPPGNPTDLLFVEAMEFEIDVRTSGSVTMEMLNVVDVLHRYLRQPDRRQPFFISPIVRWWQKSMVAAPPDRVRIQVLDQDGQRLSRQPGLFSMATVEAVEVDGEPIASRVPLHTLQPAPGRPRRALRRVREPVQGELFPGPRTLAGKTTGGLLIAAVAESDLSGDERSLLRGGLLQLGKLAYALQGSVKFSDAELALLLTGRDTPATRALTLRLLEAGRWLACWWGDRWVTLLDAEIGPPDPAGSRVHRLGAPRWWQDKRASGPHAWRLSGGLWRLPAPALVRGGIDKQRDALLRTLDGLEAALAWGDCRPVRPGGPGPDIFIPWWQVLRLAGEPVTAAMSTKGTVGRRYRRRVAALKSAGYVVPAGASDAPAGDTVEVVRIVLGYGRHSPGPGLMVRLSARYCEAAVRTDPALARRSGVQQEDPVWSMLQASTLLPPRVVGRQPPG